MSGPAVQTPLRRFFLSGQAVQATIQRAKQFLTNASIDCEPYDDPEFRLSQVDEAVKVLEALRTRLATEVVLNKLRQPR